MLTGIACFFARRNRRSTTHRVFAFLFPAVLCVGSLAAQAQTAGAKPVCAAGDAVVWENTSSKAYHLAGDKFYGNTKHGAYACRSTADSAGYHLAGAKSGSKNTRAAGPGSPAPTATETPAGSHHAKHHRKSGAIESPAPEPSPAAT